MMLLMTVTRRQWIAGMGIAGIGSRFTQAAPLAYLEKAHLAEPDAIIAIPPTEASSLDDFRDYYRALARATKLPLFIQTTGGAKGVIPTIELLVELANEFPNCGYVKEEQT